MKQTNNAIKFLMAQYRAIFQNAYFKGLATAAVVTMGLAAGQAQAATNDFTGLAGSEALTFDGTANAVSLEDSGDKSWMAPVTVTAQGKNTQNHAIKAKDKALNLTGTSGSLTVKTGNIAHGISLEGAASSALTVDINNIEVQSGLIDIKGAATNGTATVKANNITVSGKTSKISLTAGETDGAVTLGRASSVDKAGSTIILSDSGAITFDGGAASKAILNGKLVSTGGVLNISASKFGQISTYGNVESLDIKVGNSGSAAISLADVEGTNDKEDVLSINKGTITLSAADQDATLTIDKGTVNLGNDVVLQGAGTDAGKAKVVVGTASTAGNLSISKDNLVKFLDAKTGVADAKKGVLDIANSGTVLFTDETVKLDKLAFGTDAGQIKVVDGAKIGGKNVVVDSKLTGATDLIVLANDTLTLGKAGLESAKTNFVAKFETKNLNLVTSENEFTLQNAVKLNAIGDSKNAKNAKDEPIKVAQNGNINGPAINVNGGSLTIAAGNYEFGEDVTLTNGSLSVTSDVDNLDSDKVASSLKISNGNVTLKATKTESGSISVSGKNARLDLSEAGALTLESPTAQATAPNKHIISAKVSGGTLVLKGEQVAGIVKMIGENSDKASSIDLSHSGSLLIVDDLTIDGASLGKADATNAPDTATINFHNKDKESGGTLEVANTLTLTNLDSTAVDIGKDGNILADKIVLKLKENDKATEFKLGSGNYTVLSGLDSDKAIDLNSANSVLNLGKIVKIDETDPDSKYMALSSGGSISADLKLTGATTASLNVVVGDWTAKNITTGANTELNVGDDTVFTTADDKILGASLTVNDKLDAGAGVVVHNGSSLIANNIDAKASAINVSGNMTINGKYDSGTKSDDSDDKLGVKLEAGSIVIANDGNLVLQGDAMTGVVINDSGDVSFAKTLEITDGALVSESGSNVDLVFAKAGSVSKAGLDAITKKLFGKTPDGTVTLKGDVTILGLDVDKNNEISWKDKAKDYADYLPTYIDPKLQQAKLTGVGTDAITGHFGSVVTNEITTAGADVTFTKKGGLYNATTFEGDKTGNKYFALGKNNVVLGLNVDNNSEFTLANGGVTDHVTLGSSSSLVIDGKDSETKLLKDLSGKSDSYVELKSGLTTVLGKVSVDELDSKAGSKLVVAQNLSLNIEEPNVINDIKGDLEVTGKTTLAGETEFYGNNKFTGAFTASKYVGFANGVTEFAGNATFNDDLEIIKGAQVNVNGILKSSKDNNILVGEYSESEKLNSSGFLSAKYVNLNDGALILDPAYGAKSSVAEIGSFTSKTTPLSTDISTINGRILVGQNSALLLGMDKDGKVDLASARSYLQSLQDQNGSLSDAEDKVGAVLYINAQQNVGDAQQIIVDSKANNDTAFDKKGELVTKYTEKKAFNKTENVQEADLYLGGNAVLALGDGANVSGGAIKFLSTDAAVYAEQGAKIVLDGSSFLNGDRTVNVFSDSATGTGANTGVKILGTDKNSIRVETVNGLMSFYLEAGKEVSSGKLTLDTNKIDTAFTAASVPMRDFLLGYTTLTKNWQDMYLSDDQVAKDVTEETLLGVEGPAANNFVIDNSGKITGFNDKTASAELKKENIGNYVAVQTGVDADNKPVYAIYKKAYNEFLEKVVRNTQGAAADQAARMGVFGGAAETALVATSTSYDAVAGRFGMGQQAGTMTIANNGQGSGMWVTPVYKSHESDGFDADGLGYGSDITLYGLALGGDVTLANGLRVGAMFNVGSGDADGQGSASVVSNDFDYFGGSIYAGYAIDNFSIVGDVSYTNIDSDVEANTEVGKTSTSFDTTALSVGVTGQYSLKVAEMDVTPHAGMRFTRIDMDDYSIGSVEFGEVGKYNASTANVFSIPVGVTISKEYVTDTWTVKPSFDLTLTGNFGDDTVDGTVSWNGVSNWDVATKAEFVDNFTYGAAVGIAAKTGNFGLGLGLNYTGSSNTDEFGVNANARYMF